MGTKYVKDTINCGGDITIGSGLRLFCVLYAGSGGHGRIEVGV